MWVQFTHLENNEHLQFFIDKSGSLNLYKHEKVDSDLKEY